MIAAGLIGNVLEWYDFAIHGYFATAIGRHFFPHEDAVARLLSTFGVFALGYLMRPVRGVAIGYIGLGVIGGLTPLVATWLVNRTGDEIAPAFMIMAAAAVTFATLLWFRETYRKPFIGGSSGAAALYARI